MNSNPEEDHHTTQSGFLWKSWFLSVIFIGSAVMGGLALRRFREIYAAIVEGNGSLLPSISWFLAAMLLMAVTESIVAVLVRPLYVAMIVVVLAALGMLLAWGLQAGPAAGAYIFLLAGVGHLLGVYRWLGQQIRFSPMRIGALSSTALTGLSLAAGISLYVGAQAHFKRNGLVIPEKGFQLMGRVMDRYLEVALPPELQGIDPAILHAQMQQQIDRLLQVIAASYGAYIPLAFTFFVYPLIAIAGRVIAGLTGPALEVVFPMLQKAGFARIERRQEEVERIVPGWESSHRK